MFDYQRVYYIYIYIVSLQYGNIYGIHIDIDKIIESPDDNLDIHHHIYIYTHYYMYPIDCQIQ